MELAGARTGLTPLFNPSAIGRVFQNSRASIAVRDEEMSIRSERDVGGSVECAVVFRLLAHPDGHELLAERRILSHDRSTSIYGPHIACRVDADAVRYLVVPLAPRT